MHCDYIFFPDHQTRPHKSSYWLISRSFDQPNITWSRAGFRKMFSGKYFLNYYMIFFFVFSFLLVFDHSINRKCNLVKVLWAM